MKMRIAQQVVMVGLALGCAAQEPSELDQLLQQGVSLNGQGDYAHAIPLLRKAADLAPQNSSANYQLGMALFESGQANQAVDWLRNAVAIEPMSLKRLMWKLISASKSFTMQLPP